MTRQSDAIGKSLERIIASVQLELAHRIVAKLQRPPEQGGTPVDTGNARSRWVVAELGPQIDITNDAPYIMRLNDGWSKQAPIGFIERAIDEALAELHVVVNRPFRVLLSGGELFEYHPQTPSAAPRAVARRGRSRRSA